jgi:hypothetical protein
LNLPQHSSRLEARRPAARLKEGFRLSDVIQSSFKDAFEPPMELKFPYNEATITEEELREGLVFTQLYWKLIFANPDVQWRVQSTDFLFKVLLTMKRPRDLCALEHITVHQLDLLYGVVPITEIVTVDRSRAVRLEQHSGMFSNIPAPQRCIECLISTLGRGTGKLHRNICVFGSNNDRSMNV